MEVNWDAAKFLLDFVVWLIAMALAIAAWIRSGSNKNKDSILEINQKLHGHDKRIQAVEDYTEDAPTHEDITKLRVETAALNAKLTEMHNTLNLIRSYLIKS